MKTKLVAVDRCFPLALTLSACGDTWGERAVTGGGIGAGTGLAIGALAGWPLRGAGTGRRRGGRRHRRRDRRQEVTQLSRSRSLRSKTLSTSSSDSPCASLRGPL